MTEAPASYKKFRKVISELSFEDSFAATWAFSQAKQLRNFSFPTDVERHPSFMEDGPRQPYPWQLETVLREVVLRGADVSVKGKSLKKWTDLANAVNALRALEDAIHEPILGADNVLLEMLRVGHQQFLWQQLPNRAMTARYYRIFKDPEIDALCEKTTRLSVHKIYAIGSALWGHYSSKAFLKLPWSSRNSVITNEDIVAFIELCGIEVYELRQIIRASHKLDDTFPYDNRFVRAWPLISFRKCGEEILACPLPTLLFWRFTSGLYYDLTCNDAFFNAFGASFQRYVGDVFARALAGTSLEARAEEKYGTKKKPKDTVDWTVLGADAAVFVECKSKRLSIDAKTNLVSREALERDLGILADAICQTYKTIAEYKADRYPTLRFDENRKIYPVVVTLENWFPHGQLVADEIERQLKIKLDEANIPRDVLVEMPYVLASCDEVEEVAQIIAQVGIRTFFERRQDERYRGWLLDSFISDAFGDERRVAVNLFAETYDEILQPFLSAA
ncbi:hypothetical protein RLW55_04060 [Hyphomicrobium sp. B1]|uniref:hypothetical protein n=1 Tax=Hyphomicrobium sp. B1 TaxID=3075651 RepID=UPI003C30BBE8